MKLREAAAQAQTALVRSLLPRYGASKRRFWEKNKNLRRLQAQRNELNTEVKNLKDEVMLLQEPGSLVGEVIKVMGRRRSS